MICIEIMILCLLDEPVISCVPLSSFTFVAQQSLVTHKQAAAAARVNVWARCNQRESTTADLPIQESVITVKE